MNSFANLLVRCRALYLGSVSVEESQFVGSDSLHEPLSQRYTEPDVDGVDTRLLVHSSGIQIQVVKDPRQVIWFPISSLFVCASVKCVTCVNGATGRSERKFVPIDLLTPDLSDCSPPIFGFISRAMDNLVCHVFICKSDQASLMLVQCCTTAYENRDPRQDQSLSESVYLSPNGAFLANSQRFVSVFNVSNPGEEKLGQTESFQPDNWDTRSVAALPPGMKVLYAPQSVVNRGEEAIRDYFAAKQRSQRHQFMTSPRGQGENSIGQGQSPWNHTISHPLRLNRAQSPPPDYEEEQRRDSVADCPECNPRLSRMSRDAADCPICNPLLLRKQDDKNKKKNCSVVPEGRQNSDKSNPIAGLDEPELPPIDYDTENMQAISSTRSSNFPTLNDVVRRRAESVQEESVHDQVILREYRGRRADNLGVRLAGAKQNRNDRAFGRSIVEDVQARSMVVGHGPSNVYHGVVGGRLFDNLHETLGYYP